MANIIPSMRRMVMMSCIAIFVLGVAGNCQAPGRPSTMERHFGPLSSLRKSKPSWVPNEVILKSDGFTEAIKNLLNNFRRLNRKTAEDYCKAGPDVEAFEGRCYKLLAEQNTFSDLSFSTRFYSVQFERFSETEIKCKVIMHDGSVNGTCPLPTEVDYFALTDGKGKGVISLEWEVPLSNGALSSESTNAWVSLDAYWPSLKACQAAGIDISARTMEDTDALVTCTKFIR